MAVGKDLAAFSPFSVLLHDLAHRDGEINFEELALLRTTSVFIKERSSPSKRSLKSMSPAHMEMPLCMMLSAITYTTGANKPAQVAAFKRTLPP